MKQFLVDLTKIEGYGDFFCPNCGVVVSPEDRNKKIYKILETKVSNNNLEEIILQCNRCGSKIKLIGFTTESER